MRKIVIFLFLLSVFNCTGCMKTTNNQKESAGEAQSLSVVSTQGEVQSSSVATTKQETQSVREEETERTTLETEPGEKDFVKVTDYIPNVYVDLKYATKDNFTGQRIYNFNSVWLRYGTVQKLIKVEKEAEMLGYRLKIWDGFRPTTAQFKLWEICPNPTYVSNPNKGFSSHSRGNTVDVTLVYPDGREVKMPTGFDDFSKMADRDYSDCDNETAVNAKLLENLMEKNGFKPYAGEWWHFSDINVYEVEKEFVPKE